MGSGYVGILSVELHFPEAGSLKGKRHFVRSAKAQLQNRFGAAVAEVDHHELWQRSRLTVACVARQLRELDELLDAAERYLSAQEYELVRAERSIVRLFDLLDDIFQPNIALGKRLFKGSTQSWILRVPTQIAGCVWIT